MKLFYIIIPLIILSVYSASAQVTSQQVGGPIVPTGNSTQQQYCFSGICQTNGTVNTMFTNDTNKEMFSKYPIIMIIPSELCTTALHNHIKTGCPPLQAIAKYDTSNQKISGYFYSRDGMTLERSNPQVKNHWQYYAYSNKTIVCVYCTGNYLIADLYKTITIEPGNFQFVPHTYQGSVQTQFIRNSTGGFSPYYSTLNEINAGLTSYSNRFVTDDCLSATLTYSDKLLNDTINYMKSGCKKTSFHMSNQTKIPDTPWVYDNPFSTLHYKAVTDQIKSKFFGDCTFHKCNLTTSIRKW